jgi:hypothetical protein
MLCYLDDSSKGRHVDIPEVTAKIEDSTATLRTDFEIEPQAIFIQSATANQALWASPAV